MFKKVLISGLVAIVALGILVSAYNVIAGPAASEASVARGAGQSVPPLAASEQSGALSAAPQADPGLGAAAQGSGQPLGAASRGSDWQSDAVGQGAGQGSRFGQGGQGQGGQGQGGRGQGGQGQGRSGQGAGSGVPNPQAAQNESLTLHGVVSNYTAAGFTLITDDGQSVAVQLGNQRFVNDLGMALQDGAVVTLVGFYEAGGAFAPSTLTLDLTGQTYTLRDQASGRPLWAGGPKNRQTAP